MCIFVLSGYDKVKKKKYIPVREFSIELGFEVRHHLKGVDEKGLESRHHLNSVSKEGTEKFYAHRNDNYMFIVTERGNASMDIDFNTVKFIDKDIYFVAPGQVQDNPKGRECDYWYIEVSTSLIPKEYLTVFENAAPFQKPQNMSAEEFEQCQAILHLLLRQLAGNPDWVFYKQIMQELLQTFLCLIARKYAQNDALGNASRPQQITRDFKRLLEENMKLVKSPSHYAAMLNISEAYLNEVIKKTTGFTTGYWIRYCVILEAKRLLFHTEMNVKEIAYALGYEDHTYFSKLFRQTTETTPLAFRAKHLK
jgi:AraC-like DNA-binding protein